MRNELMDIVNNVSTELEAVYEVIELSKRRDINIAAAPIKEEYAVNVIVEALKKAGFGVTVEEHLTSCFGDKAVYLVVTW
jgi:hypothetical protein